jgi:cell wall-associated NlpC family hydrolase
MAERRAYISPKLEKMKWLLIALAVLFAGWQAAVYFFNRSSATETLTVTDSLQAMAPLLNNTKIDSVKTGGDKPDTVLKKEVLLPVGSIDTKGVHPQEVVAYAKTLIGITYKYGSTDPAAGFDCSGFVTHVFGHFKIVVPRSSIDFTHVGKEVSAMEAKPGDLVLFRGTDSTERFVGHMGIVVSNDSTLNFIHSTSGRQYGVTITPLNDYYQGRYVKTIRIFPQNTATAKRN